MIKFFWIPKEVWYYVVFPIFGILIFYMIFNLFYSKKKGSYYYNYVVDYVYSSLGTIFCGLLFCLLLGYSIATLQILNTNNLMRAYPLLTILLIILPIIPTAFLVYVISIFYKNLNRKEILDRNLEAKINGENISYYDFGKKENNVDVSIGSAFHNENDDKENSNIEIDYKSKTEKDDNNFDYSEIDSSYENEFKKENYESNENDNQELINHDDNELSKTFDDKTLISQNENKYFCEDDYTPIKLKKDNVNNSNHNDNIDIENQFEQILNNNGEIESQKKDKFNNNQVDDVNKSFEKRNNYKHKYNKKSNNKNYNFKYNKYNYNHQKNKHKYDDNNY